MMDANYCFPQGEEGGYRDGPPPVCKMKSKSH